MLTRAAISGDSFPSVSQHHLTVTTEQKLALVTRSCAGALQGGKFSKLQWKLFAYKSKRMDHKNLISMEFFTSKEYLYIEIN